MKWRSFFEQQGYWIVLVLLSLLALLSRTGSLAQVWQPLTGVVDDLQNEGPNEVSEDLITQNYYQKMMDHRVSSPSVPRWVNRAARLVATLTENDIDEGRGKLRPDPILRSTKAVRYRDDYLGYEFLPNFSMQHRGVTVRTNRWGMRDRDYTKERPAGTFRIALVGGSNTMGSAVREEETFGNLLEERLNQELAGRHFDRFEVLNFSVEGYFMDRRLFVVDHLVADFDPQLVIVTMSTPDVRLVHRQIAQCLEKNQRLPYAFFDEILAKAEVRPGDEYFTKVRKLNMFSEAFLDGCLAELKRFSRETGIEVAIAVVRIRAQPEIHESLKWEARTARRHGLTVLEVFDAYEGKTPSEVNVDGLRDLHPNVAAHRLLADDLYTTMSANPRIAAMISGQ